MTRGYARHARTIIALAISCLCASSAAFALKIPSTSSVRIYVEYGDESTKPYESVDQALVSIQSTTTSFSRTMLTASGFVQFLHVPKGDYEVTVELGGCGTQSKSITVTELQDTIEYFLLTAKRQSSSRVQIHVIEFDHLHPGMSQPIIGATTCLSDEHAADPSNRKHCLITDENGFATFSDLPHQTTYSVRINFPGYEPTVKRRIVIKPGETITIEIIMKPKSDILLL